MNINTQYGPGGDEEQSMLRLRYLPCLGEQWLSTVGFLFPTLSLNARGKRLPLRSKQVLPVTSMDILCAVPGGEFNETIPVPGVMHEKIMIIRWGTA